METIQGKTLRVSFPGDSSDGYALFTESTLSGPEKTGSTVAFMEIIREKYNMTFEFRDVSEKSSSRYKSSYTACVHEVGRNIISICGVRCFIVFLRFQ